MVHQVGAGVHGPVFLATGPDDDRQVAVKTFPLDITPERAATLAAALRQLVSTPLGHPSIVPLLDAGSEGSTVYLVQEYVLAESVDTALREYGPAPVPDALRLVGQLAGAIDFAAVAGVHHGALHPRDVLVAPNEVRLTGLGVAEAFEQVGLHVGARRPYSAPERHERRAWGTPADVFSLAAVGFEMLTGRRPGSAEAIAADARSIPAPDPAALAEVFARALSGRPGDRFQTALAFAASLRHALTGEPIDPRTPADEPDAEGGRAGAVTVAAAASAPIGAPETLAPGEPPIAEETTAPLPEEGTIVPPAAVEADREAAPAAIERPFLAAPEPPVQAQEELPPPSGGEPPAPLDSPAARDEAPEAERATPPELAVFAPEARDQAGRAPVVEEPAVLPIETPGVAREPFARFEEDEQPIDEFRADEAEPEEERPAGPVELGEEPKAPRPESPLLPLEIEMEPERPPAPERLVLPPSPPVRPAVHAGPTGPPPRPRPEGELPQRRARFPLSSLLAMLLLGIAAGFIGGFVVGRGEPAVPGGSREADGGAVAGTPSGGDPTLSKVPPSEAARPETAAPGAGGVEPQPAAPAEGTTREAARPPVSTPAPAAPAASRAPSRASAPRRTPPPDDQDEEPDRPFEAPLSVISRPPGALVRLDGRPVGKTPLQLSKIRAGAHVVRLELNGYLPWTSAIQVVSGAQNRVTASLDRRPGGIE